MNSFNPIGWHSPKPDDNSHLDSLPNPDKVQMLTKLDLPELATVSLVSKFWNAHVVNPYVWISIANEVQFFLNERVPAFKQVINGIQGLRIRVELENHPQDLDPILRGPTVKQVKHIQNYLEAKEVIREWKEVVESFHKHFPDFPRHLFGPDFDFFELSAELMIDLANSYPTWKQEKAALFRAQDILIFWSVLARVLQVDPPEIPMTEEGMIAKATEFPDWFNVHEEWLRTATGINLDVRLYSLPQEFFRLTNLFDVILTNCRLTSLPPEIGKLTQLRHLDLSNNWLTHLPHEIGSCTQLEHIDLMNNRLESLPPTIGNWSRLSTLDLQFNRLSALPEEIGKCTNIRELKLFHNHLTALPRSLKHLKELQQLGLTKNQLRRVPEEIGALHSLKNLELEYNQLSTIPPTVGNLTNLTRLQLNDNALTSLIPEVGNCAQLEDLNLSCNLLTKLPSEMDKLTALKRLSVAENHLIALPSGISTFPNLNSLDISKNQLTEAPKLAKLPKFYKDDF